RALLKLLGQPPRRLGVAREHHHAGHRPVEAMGNAEVDVAGFVIAIFNVGFNEAFKAWYAGGGLRQQRRRLDYGEAMVVLEQDDEFRGHGVSHAFFWRAGGVEPPLITHPAIEEQEESGGLRPIAINLRRK